MDDLIRKVVEDTYQHILETANQVLTNCKRFSVQILQLEDPSYEDIADHLVEAAEIIDIISGAYPDDPDGFYTASKAMEYAVEIKTIAKAIRVGDEALVEELANKLDRRPFT